MDTKLTEDRFGFGANWARFLESIEDDNVQEAVRSLRSLLDRESLNGLSFLDVGSGSGLFSLAARLLGAQVRSFDYDTTSVACTEKLRAQYLPDQSHWTIEAGSILDEAFVNGLGTFNVVYSWGVLHHTGQMWQAMDLIDHCVAPGGVLCLAIYNDQGLASRLWWHIKRTYVKASRPLRGLLVALCYVPLWGPAMLRDLLLLRPARTWRVHSKRRGMSPHRDVVDWVGGFPFEVASREAVIDFYEGRGYRLVKLGSVGASLGCNEFVFQRTDQLNRP